MNAFEQALQKNNLSINDFELREEFTKEEEEKIENEISCEKEIKFWEDVFKLEKENATPKSKYKFAVKNDFLSWNHLMFYGKVLNELHEKEFELETVLNNYEPTLKGGVQIIEQLNKQISELKSYTIYIRRITAYKLFMFQIGEKDISPYGEDLIRKKDRSSEVRDINIDDFIKYGW